MILRNDFHKTAIQVNLRGRNSLSAYKVRTAWKTLCGIKTCTCGGVAGERPAIQGGKEKYRLEACQDGTASVIRIDCQ